MCSSDLVECMSTCWFDSDHASDYSILLSHFQPVCELVDLTLTTHLTILSFFLIYRLYVSLLIYSDYASDHSVLLSHFQEVGELVDLTLTTPLTIPFAFSFPGRMWTC